MTADVVGGVWQYALDLSAALRRRGVDVVLAVMGPPPDAHHRAEAASVGVSVFASSYRLEWMDQPWDDVARAGNWLLDLESQVRPDVVHLNGFCHADLLWRAPVVVVGHSCVCSWHRRVRGTVAPDYVDEYRRRVAHGLAAAQVVVAPSADMLRLLGHEYGHVFDDGRVIANGRQCATNATKQLPAKSPLVLSVGRVWDEAKNIAALCSVAPSLAWPVYVAGDTRAPGDSDHSGIGLERPEVTFLGRLRPSDMRPWFRRASIYALPARYEPFGLSVLEAASAGCALVLGRIASLRENWSGAAIFVDPDDVDALRWTPQRLIADGDARRDLAERATRRAALFTVDRMADGYVSAYADTHAKRASRRQTA
jgi:glycosyltransferase involved in cell wall biosynthesis